MMDRLVPRRVALATVAAVVGVVPRGADGRGTPAAQGRSRPPAGGEASSGAAEYSQKNAPVAVTSNMELWMPWLELWNGDLAVADEIVASDFVAHFASLGGGPGEVRGPDGLKEWIGGILAAFSDHRFATTVGPLADGDLIAGRWLFRATYQGGIPGATSTAVGSQVEYAGIDILRIESTKLVEYWLCADTLDLLQQIGAIPA